MAITLLESPTTPDPVEKPVGSDSDWTLMMTQLTACKALLKGEQAILTEMDSYNASTAIPKIAQGTYLQHLGSIYIVDTEDYVIQGSAAEGINYIELSVSGDNLIATWTQSTAGYSWNHEYQGMYDSSDNQLMPYIVTKSGTDYTKSNIKYNDQYIDSNLKITGNITSDGDAQFGNYALKNFTSGDLDTVTVSGMYRLGDPVDHSNLPSNNAQYGQLLVIHGASDSIAQIIFPFANDEFYYRSGNPSDVGGSGNWRNWKTVTQSNQDLRTTDDVTFNNIALQDVSTGSNKWYELSQTVTQTDNGGGDFDITFLKGCLPFGGSITISAILQGTDYYSGGMTVKILRNNTIVDSSITWNDESSSSLLSTTVSGWNIGDFIEIIINYDNGNVNTLSFDVHELYVTCNKPMAAISKAIWKSSQETAIHDTF